ncbi:MAG: hypothetical protein JW904_08935 [Spirochaetales bacterium]|nr:hypothetical protein [Spirochaetales bacterium]
MYQKNILITQKKINIDALELLLNILAIKSKFTMLYCSLMEQRRWYDEKSELAQYLDVLKTIQTEKRVKIVQGVLSLINNANPNLIEDFIANYRLDLYQKRWYDADPYLWLIYNGLAFGKENLTNQVIEYLKKNVQLPK